MAERDAAIHAPRRLLLQVVLVERQRELAEVANAVARELIFRLDAVVFEETCNLAHHAYSAACSIRTAPFPAAPFGIPLA
jgi:hypothetical protein